MPEPYWPKRKNSYTLADAAKSSRYAKLRCRYCKAERYYLIEDLKVAFGNIECDDVTRAQRWRCTRCNQRDMLDFSIEHPSAADLQKIVLRRIDRVEYVRRVIWRDAKGVKR